VARGVFDPGAVRLDRIPGQIGSSRVSRVGQGAFQIKGLDDLQRVLDKLPGKVQAKVHEAALRAGANLWAREARLRAPVRSGSAAANLKIFSKFSRKARRRIAIGRIGGFLQRNIRVQKQKTNDPEEIRLRVGPNRDAFYGNFIEWGYTAADGKRIAPKPFLKPAFDTKKKEVLERISKAVGKRVEKEAAKLARVA